MKRNKYCFTGVDREAVLGAPCVCLPKGRSDEFFQRARGVAYDSDHYVIGVPYSMKIIFVEYGEKLVNDQGP